MGQHTLNRLSVTKVNALIERGYYADGGGLYFRVSAFSTRSWAFRYTRAGKAREMGLGAYPDVTLKEARERAAEARKQLREDIDPIDQRQEAKSAMIATRAAVLTFDQCATAYIAAHRSGWKNAKHADQWKNTISTYASPIIGAVSVDLVSTVTLLKILEPIWTTKTETASRLRGRIESMLDWATVRGYRKGDNPARWKGHLDKLLAAPSKVRKIEHHAALPYSDVGAFLAELRQQAGMGARALEFAILTVARSGEVRGATWAEVDINSAVWTIPAERMKAGREHRIPLSEAALELLRALPRIDGSDLLFPNTKGTELSDMTLTAVLRRMGRPVTAHGFRSSFRDWAGETTAYPREVIEHALAHQLKDKAEAAYARGSLFDKRRRLMADWAAYCSVVAVKGGTVVQLRGQHN
ncbi:tyrosine-type recombinase/integrase [Candidatus Nitrotoga arctica]|uniref:Integrase n=1 Tax=Candidatus Nitrotoga arctica TaxID=453162 RepID=A0ABM8YXJ9_9PROT|nr:site-specific integrase [Candidatus Nitrotoga arctica]CAG9932225.1 Integrase [Candidatus Nitrotoga arctica]